MVKSTKKKSKERENKATKKFSITKIVLIYVVPIFIICSIFPYDKIFLKNEYPFTISSSGSVLNWKMGFSPIPAEIPIDSSEPFLNAIGISRDLLSYQTCFEHESFFYIKNKKTHSDTVKLDVRVKLDSTTNHIKPNKKLCIPSNALVEKQAVIFVGDAEFFSDLNSDEDIAKELKKNKDLPFEGRSEVRIKRMLVEGKTFAFLLILFSFCPIYWAAIIAWHTVHKLIYIEPKK